MNDERSLALAVVHKLRDAGYEALWAGGCVRDQLLGLPPHDFDVATSARPEDVRGLFRRTIAVGASFGVVEVLGPKTDGERLKVQVATFRVEGPYSDGRRPDEVHFSTAEEDAKRRDFTINGMFYDPVEQQVIDYVGGQGDLGARILRAIGDPHERFAEDKLRLLRAVRFAARFELQIEPRTLAAIRAMADQINMVSAERIGDELRKMLTHVNRVRAVMLLWDTGLLQPLFPELIPLRGFPRESAGSPAGDLWEHVESVLANLEAPSFPLAFAALLHEVGKSPAGQNHETVSRQLVSEICLRYRLSNAERERVEWLVEKHESLGNAHEMRLSALKTVLAHPGIRELLALHRADALADGGSIEHVEFCERKLDEWGAADLKPPPVLTGDDLLRMGLKAGPRFKEILDRVYEAQLEGHVTTFEDAKKLAEEVIREMEGRP
jgi:poly(A) polymerase